MIVQEPSRVDWSAALDERTLEVLEHRRRVGIRRPRGWLVRRLLLAADVTALVAAFLCVEVIFGPGGGERNRFDLWTEILLFMLTIPGWVVVSKLYGLYERDEERADHSTADDLVGVFHLVTVGTWLLLVGGWATGLAAPDVARLAVFWVLAVFLVTLARAGARALCRRQLAYLQNTIILGSGSVAQLVAQKFRHHPEYGINVVGFVDEPRNPDEPPEQPDDSPEQPALLATPEELPELVRALGVERVVIAFFSARDADETLELVRSLEDLDVLVDIVPHLYELFGPSVRIHSVEGLPLLGLPPVSLSRSSRLLKRAMDIALALPGLLVLAPFFALFALLIKRDSPGPVFFRQRRVGCRGEIFTIYKFRTMTADADERKAEFAALNKHAQAGGDPRMFKIVDDPRTTSVGRFLRRYSLDELPQLINVLKGEMSLVGPRPLIPEEGQYVERWGLKRVTINPGITGPWQVLGRSRIPFEEMVKLDYLYVTQWSLFNDFKLLLRTIPTLWYVRDDY